MKGENNSELVTSHRRNTGPFSKTGRGSNYSTLSNQLDKTLSNVFSH